MDKKTTSPLTFDKFLEATERLIFKTQAIKAKAERLQQYDIWLNMKNTQQKLFALRKLGYKINGKFKESESF